MSIDPATVRPHHPPWRTLAFVVAIIAAVVIGENFAIAAFFPQLSRLTTDFSPTYLSRDIRTIAKTPGAVVFLGDSVLWGYRIPADRTAIALIADRGCRCENLAFKGGSPPNYYALVRAMAATGARPRTVVIEINQKVLNPADAAYATLHPAIAVIAESVLTNAERRALNVAEPAQTLQTRAAAALVSISSLYAMRSDIRETLYGDADAPPTAKPSAELYEGTYDLTALDAKNFGVRYLAATFAALASEHVRVIAFLTPTNHTLLHDYIDSDAYRANGAYLVHLARASGADVLDLDKTFGADRFIDESHLTPHGQRELASILAKAIGIDQTR